MSENKEQVYESEEFQVLLRKYEDMRSGVQSIFFDVEEFEQIIDYYLDDFQYEEAREAAKFGNQQHPGSVEIKYKFIYICSLCKILTQSLIHPELLRMNISRSW